MADMPIKIQDISDLVQVLTGCSSKDADRAGAEICRSPEALALLAKACGVSTSGVGIGGALVVVGMGSSSTGVLAVGGVPVWAIGAGLAGVSGMAAKRFCNALVEQSGRSVSSAMLLYLRK